MTATSTITVADRLIPLMAGEGSGRTCEQIAPGRYLLSDATEETWATTAVNIVVGAFTWSTEILDDMTSAKAAVDTASAVLASRFEDAVDLTGPDDPRIGQSLWERVKSRTVQSGFVATLHDPPHAEGHGAAVLA